MTGRAGGTRPGMSGSRPRRCGAGSNRVRHRRIYGASPVSQEKSGPAAALPFIPAGMDRP